MVLEAAPSSSAALLQQLPGARTALLNGISGGSLVGALALLRYRNPLKACHVAVGSFAAISAANWELAKNHRARVEATKRMYRSSGRSSAHAASVTVTEAAPSPVLLSSQRRLQQHRGDEQPGLTLAPPFDVGASSSSATHMSTDSDSSGPDEPQPPDKLDNSVVHIDIGEPTKQRRPEASTSLTRTVGVQTFETMEELLQAIAPLDQPTPRRTVESVVRDPFRNRRGKALHNMLIQAITTGQSEMAYNRLVELEMVGAASYPSGNTYRAMLLHHMAKQEPEQAVELLKRMLRKRRVSPTLQMYTDVMALCARTGKLGLAQTVLAMYKNSGLAPSAAIYNAYLRVGERIKRLSATLDAFAQALSDGAPLDASAFATVLRAVANVAHLDELQCASLSLATREADAADAPLPRQIMQLAQQRNADVTAEMLFEYVRALQVTSSVYGVDVVQSSLDAVLEGLATSARPRATVALCDQMVKFAQTCGNPERALAYLQSATADDVAPSPATTVRLLAYLVRLGATADQIVAPYHLVQDAYNRLLPGQVAVDPKQLEILLELMVRASRPEAAMQVWLDVVHAYRCGLAATAARSTQKAKRTALASPAQASSATTLSSSDLLRISTALLATLSSSANDACRSEWMQQISDTLAQVDAKLSSQLNVAASTMSSVVSSAGLSAVSSL